MYVCMCVITDGIVPLRKRKELKFRKFEELYLWKRFLGGSNGKASARNVGDSGLIPGLGRSPGGRHDNPIQYSCQENPHGQRSLAGCRPWVHKESDTTKHSTFDVIELRCLG